MGMSGESYRIASGMLLIYCVEAVIRMQNWCMNDTYRAAGDSAFGSIMELTFMFLLVQPVIHLANDALHAPFLLVFALCYVDEPIRYVIMQVHMYSRKWIKPVSEEGLATIDAFRYLDVDSSYLQLAVGDNLFRYSADTNAENLEVSIYHNNLYLGV